MCYTKSIILQKGAHIWMQQKAAGSAGARGFAATAAGAVLWGLSGCFAQYLFGVKGVQAAWLVAVRLTAGGALLTAVGFLRSGRANLSIFRSRADVLALMRFAVLGLWFSQFTYFSAVQHANAGTATVLQGTSPVLLLAAACIRGRRRPRAFELWSVAFVLAGIFLLSTHGRPGSMALSGPALFYGLLSSLAAAFYSTMGARLLPRFGVYQAVGWGMLCAGVAFSALVRPWRDAPAPDAATLAALAGVVVLGTAAAFALFLQGASIIGPLPAMLVGSLEPLVAIVVSVVFLASPFTPADGAGMACVLGAVTALGLRGARAQARSFAQEE